MEIITIHEAIARSEQLPLSGILYAPVGEELTWETKCALITYLDWDYQSDEDPPESYNANGIRTVELLPVDPFQQVVWNAKNQQPDASIETIVEALKYYVEWDAFINFDDGNI